MFGLFKQRKWTSEILPELSGSYGGLRVVLSNFPCRVDLLSGKRSYVYYAFGDDFIHALHNALGDFEQLRQTLAATGSKKVCIQLPELPLFQVEITGSVAGQRQFYSDIADALIEAFASQGIQR